MLVKIKDNIVIGFASSNETPEEGVTIVNGDGQNFGIGSSYNFETKKFHKSFNNISCLLYTSPSPRDAHESRMPSSA